MPNLCLVLQVGGRRRAHLVEGLSAFGIEQTWVKVPASVSQGPPRAQTPHSLRSQQGSAVEGLGDKQKRGKRQEEHV